MQKTKFVKHIELKIVLMNLGVTSTAEKLDFLNTSNFEHFGSIH